MAQVFSWQPFPAVRARVPVVVMCAVTMMALGVRSAPLQAEPWSGKGELGLVLAQGNSDAETINAKLEMARQTDAWKNSFTLAALRASNDGERNAERYAASWQTDFRFSPESYWYNGARYEDDRFSGFDYQASLTTGLGHRFIDEDELKIFGQAGVGYRRLENSLTGESDDSVIFSGESNTFAANELALEVKINSRLSVAAGLGVRHNTDPPAGRDKTDTLTTLNLVYGF